MSRTPTKLFAVSEDKTYPLSDGTVLFESTDGPTVLYYISDNGLGMPPITRITERGPQQHGDSDVDYRLEPRIVNFIFAIHAPAVEVPADLETARELLLRIFRPSNTSIALRYVRSNGAVRQIDAHLMGGMNFASTERDPDTWFQRFNMDFRMADPTFYDPWEDTASFANPTLGGAGLVVPLPVPFAIRGDGFTMSKDIFYTGSAEALPIITLYGPLVSPVMTNESTGQILSFPDVSIPIGGYYTIDLRADYKTVTDHLGARRTSELSSTSALYGWSLPVSYSPQHISLTSTYAGAQPEVARITWNTRYIGI